MPEEIYIGDVVQLKSGGPQMTVEEINGKEIFCRWFDEKNVLQDAEFPKIMLKKIQPAQPDSFFLRNRNTL